MGGRQHLDLVGASGQGLPDGDLPELDEGGRFGWDPAEIGPDQVVEDVGAQCADGVGQGVDLQRLAASGTHGVHHQGQGGDMVQVGVGQEHALDPAHFVQRQVADTRAGIDQRVVIDQERRGPTVLCDGAGTA